MTLLSADLDDPSGYGRVIRKSTKNADVHAIVEESCERAAKRFVRSTRVYAFSVPAL
jgi:bifunctional N-acetylglucosamine-1-phosphate-uridyltransferase/glucosamine-1-phosphate-acetyltransferase GlmU-like protein